MKYITDIIKVVNKKRLSKIDIFDSSMLSTKDSLFTKLYLGLNDGKIVDDADAANFLYGTEPDAKYRKLKSRFVKRLLNTLFFIDINETASRKNHYSAKQLSLEKTLAQCKILRLMQAKTAVNKLIRQNYSVAEKYGFTEVSLSFSAMLLNNYAIKGDRNNYLKEKENYLLFSKRSQLETAIRVLYYDIVSRLIWSANLTEEEATAYFKEIKTLEEENAKVNSYYGTSFLAHIKLTLFAQLGLYEEAYEESDKAIQYLLKYKDLNDKTKIGLISNNRIMACLNLGRFEEGYKTCEQNLEVFAKDGDNRSLFYAKYFQLAMHDDNLEIANNCYETIIGDGLNTQKTTSSLTQIWAVNEVYLTFLIQHKKARHISDELYSTTFKPTKFENNVYKLMHDKSGYGVGIWIVNFLFAFLQDDRDYILDRNEALNVYRTRYLKDDRFKRSALFLKMLLTVPKKDFDSFRLKQLHENNYNTLKNNPENLPIQEWEIIPYDRLWLYILEMLKGR